MDFAAAETRLGNVHRAIGYLQRVTKQDPDNATAHYKLSILYHQIQRSDLASREAAEFERLKEHQTSDGTGPDKQ